MKKINNLYSKLYNINNVDRIYKVIRKKVKNKKVLYRFEKNLNSNIKLISDVLYNKKYSFSKYNIFLISEPKYRLIMSENIYDKIVNHLVTKYILKPLEPKLIDTNVATRKGKGSNYAFKMFIKYINILQKNKEIYVLKIDVKKYFYNIDHNILKYKLMKYIKDKDALNILFHIIDSTNSKYVNEEIIECKNKTINNINDLKLIEEIDSIPIYQKDKGLPIGNMTSQFFAIFYLNDIDHYIKEVLKVKYYIRYMDDLIIIDNDKYKLKKYKEIIIKLLKNEKLEANKKTKIYSLKNGISFLGYNFKYDNKLLIKVNNKTNKRINKKLKYLYNNDYSLYYKSIRSYNGLYIRCNYKGYNMIKENSIYDRYKNLKKDFNKHIVIVKSGIFYYTYDNDAYILKEIFGYKIINNKVGFPCKSNIINIINSYYINTVILENNNIIKIDFDNNKYDLYFEKVLNNQEKESYINNIMKLVIEIINKSSNNYEEIYNFLKEMSKNINYTYDN